MKKDDLIILLIGLLLLAGMLITIFFGGEKSRHGVGLLMDEREELSRYWHSVFQKPVTQLKKVHVHTPVI